eukprot:jgi/Hompol1/1446/HPOL_001142-RA
MDKSSQKESKRSHRKHLNPLAIKYGHHESHKTKDPDSKSSLAKNIRSTQRLLARKQDLERQLKSYQLRLAKRVQEDKEKKLFETYKYVRFVATRKLEQAKKALSDQRQKADLNLNDEDAASVKRDLQKLEADVLEQELHVAYTKHYPRDEKYVSLYPKQPMESNSVSAQLQARVFEKLRSAMEQGLLDKPGFVLRMKSADQSDNELASGSNSKNGNDNSHDGGDDGIADTLSTAHNAATHERTIVALVANPNQLCRLFNRINAARAAASAVAAFSSLPHHEKRIFGATLADTIVAEKTRSQERTSVVPAVANAAVSSSPPFDDLLKTSHEQEDISKTLLEPKVPALLQRCLQFLDTEEAGSAKNIKQIRDEIEKRHPEMDMVSVIASLVKLWMRELQDGIVPKEYFSKFNEAGSSAADLRDAISCLPEINRATLAYLCRFLVRVDEHITSTGAGCIGAVSEG